MNISERITLNPEVCKGKPTIRNMRFTVAQLLELLAGGMSVGEILENYPYLEEEDIHTCLAYAAQVVNAKSIIPANLSRKTQKLQGILKVEEDFDYKKALAEELSKKYDV